MSLLSLTSARWTWGVLCWGDRLTAGFADVLRQLFSHWNNVTLLQELYLVTTFKICSRGIITPKSGHNGSGQKSLRMATLSEKPSAKYQWFQWTDNNLNSTIWECYDITFEVHNTSQTWTHSILKRFWNFRISLQLGRTASWRPWFRSSYARYLQYSVQIPVTWCFYAFLAVPYKPSTFWKKGIGNKHRLHKEQRRRWYEWKYQKKMFCSMGKLKWIAYNCVGKNTLYSLNPSAQRQATPLGKFSIEEMKKHVGKLQRDDCQKRNTLNVGRNLLYEAAIDSTENNLV